jgi:hypothetical protein
MKSVGAVASIAGVHMYVVLCTYIMLCYSYILYALV